MEHPNKFIYLANLIGNVTKKGTSRQEKIELVNEFIRDWKASNKNIFPALRNLFPDHDNQRSASGIKESKLASLYCQLLALPEKSENRKKLENWKDATLNGEKAGDFGAVLKSVLRQYQQSLKQTLPNLTIDQVNELIDSFLAAKDRNSKQDIMFKIFHNCTAAEQVLIAKIIHKNVKFGISLDTVLGLYHPEGVKFFKYCSDLFIATQKLLDPNFKMTERKVTLGHCFFPQSSARLKSLNDIYDHFNGGRKFFMQTKLDGWRMLLHYDRGIFTWYSRSLEDFSNLYGKDSKSGSLAPIISQQINSEVTSCILDGEVVPYDEETGRYLASSKMKSVSKEVTSDVETRRRVCFHVFDILLLNEVNLINETLENRLEILKNVFKEYPNVVEILSTKQGYNVADLESNLFESMEKGEEGLMVKDPLSFYDPGSHDNWFKVKPDYFDSLSDDLDVMLVGGYYGEGRSGGLFSSFACAVRDDTVESDLPVLKTICKVGSGLDRNTIDILSKDSHLFLPYTEVLPKWLNFTLKKKPDRLIPFSSAPIIQIRGSQITRLIDDPLGFEIRFPRFIEIRNDKSVETMTTLSQVSQMANRPGGMMQSISENSNLSHITKKRKYERSVLAGHRGADLKNIDRGSSIFQGITFWIVPASAGFDPSNLYLDKEKIKKDLEEQVFIHGGDRVQGGKEDLDNFLIVADHLTQRVRNHIKTGKYDIVKSSYISDCIEKKRLLPLYPRYMICSKESTKRNLEKYVDEYGDSFTEDLMDDDLEYLFDKATMAASSSLCMEEYSPGDELDFRIQFNTCVSSIQERYFLTPDPSWLFSRCVFYLDMYDKIVVDSSFIRSEYMRSMNYELVSLSYDKTHHVPKKDLPGSNILVTYFKILNRFGTIVDRICDQVSHIIVPRSAPNDLFKTVNELLNYCKSSYSKRPYFVSHEWIEESIRQNNLQDELAFKAIKT